MGLSNRAGERATIGKFGLGLKSVFHLCEAFFYLASDDAAAAQGDTGEAYRDILNPWSGDDPDDELGLHHDWDTFGDVAQQCIVTHLQRLLGGGSWFCLWIPLRQSRHCTEYAPITPFFPGDPLDLAKPDGRPAPLEDIFSAQVVFQLSDLLPMLRCVQSIRLWKSGSDTAFTLYASATLGPGAIRRHLYADEHGPGVDWSLAGHVAVQYVEDGRTIQAQCLFSGKEIVLNDARLTELQQDKDWPSYSTIDAATGRYCSQPDKAQPHAAAYFTQGAPRRDDFRLGHAVFLPIDDEQEIPCDGGSDVRLILHGYFYVDAGRSRLLVEGENQATRIQSRWNDLLARHGTYPLVLPALQQFVRDAALSSDEMRSLTKALSNAPLFIQRREALCGRWHWACCLTGDGDEAWDLVDVAEPLYVLPSQSGSTRAAFATFPALHHLCEQLQVKVTLSTSPSLTAREAPPWPEHLALQMLTLPAASVFKDEESLSDVVAFLHDHGRDNGLTSAVEDAVITLLRDALQQVPLKELSQRCDLVGALIANIAPTRRCALTSNSEGRRGLLVQELIRHTRETLLLPKDLDPKDNPSTGVLALDDAIRLLSGLRAQPPDWDDTASWPDLRAALALDVLTAAGEHRVAVLQSCSSLALFPATEGASLRTIAVSAHDLEQAHLARTLFVDDGQQATRQTASVLQRALRGGCTLIIKKSVADLLVGPDTLSPCREGACIAALLLWPPLAAPAERVRLLMRLQQTELTPKAVQGVRYLLHGELDQVHDTGPLYVQATSTDGVWAELARRALAYRGQYWRVIPLDMARALQLGQWLDDGVLGVEAIGPAAVVRLLRQCGPGRIACDDLEPRQRDEVLLYIDDLDVLGALPIHEDIDGNLVAIGPRTFLGDDFPVDRALLQGVTVLRRSDNPRIQDQQKRLVPSLDATAAIDLALSQEDPSNHWLTIMTALELVDYVRIAPDIQRAVRESLWLPRIGGGSLAPRQILSLPKIQEDVLHVLGPDGEVAPPEQLLDEVRNHQAFSLLDRRVFPQQHDALRLLGTSMAADTQYHLGPVKEETFNIAVFLEACIGVPDDVMPALPIVRNVVREFGEQDCLRFVMPSLWVALPQERYIAILAALCTQHQDGARARRESIEEVYTWYLAAALSAPNARVILAEIRLLNQQGAWKAAADLCLQEQTDGVDESDLLDRRQARVVGPVLSGGPGAPQVTPAQQASAVAGRTTVSAAEIARQVEQGAAILADYFTTWRDAVSHEAIGGFLSLLGNQTAIHALAGAYLKESGRSVGITRQLFGWAARTTVVLSTDSQDDTIERAMGTLRLLVRTVDAGDDFVEVTSLLGTTFRARKNARVDTLLIGSDGGGLPVPGFAHPVRLLRLRTIDPQSMTPHDLSTLLRETARLLMRRWFYQQLPGLNDGWATLTQDERLDVQVARRLLLESAFFYLRQLDLHMDQRLGPIMRMWDDARRRVAEEEQLDSRLAAPRSRQPRDSGKDRLRLALVQFQELIRGHPDTQQLILQAMRQKMDQYQYKVTSIPFELFQNADDALVELGAATGSIEHHRFVLAWDAHELAIAHWGRAINQPGDGSPEQNRSFERDLEKMLMLGSSDKAGGPPEQEVTGKFGLGFKSVFLLTDSPRVISGQLDFKVVAGLYPERLAQDELAALTGRLRDVSSTTSRAGTFIVLPARDDAAVIPTDAVGPFRACAHVLLVFARRIKQCELRSVEGTITLSWQENPVPGAPEARVGRLQPSLLTPHSTDSTALVLRAPEGDLLLALGQNGFQPLPDDIPRLWVTAPTDSGTALPFALNGPFAVDVGRTQLASSSARNDDVARTIGRSVGETLCQLFDAAAGGWSDFRTVMKLAPTTTPYMFWASLWTMVTAPLVRWRTNTETAHLMRLAALVLVENDTGGLGRLVTSRAALPTGLPDPYMALTRVAQVRSAVSGYLAREDVFAVVSRWPSFMQAHHPGELVHASIYRALEQLQLLPDQLRCRQVDLGAALADAVQKRDEITPDIARQLGTLFTPAFLQDLTRDSRAEGEEYEEYGRLRAILDRLRFRARDGRFHPARELLLHADDGDEGRRTAFAPPERILAAEYEAAGRAFFTACRQFLRASVADMVLWALAARDSDLRAAVLLYLLNGEHAGELERALRDRMPGTWLATLTPASPEMADLSPQERTLVRVRLGLFVEPETERPPYAPVRKPEQILNDIYIWWTGLDQREQERLEDHYYHDERIPSLRGPFDEGDIQCRADWLTLFVLAMTYTMGGQQPAQHRGFLDMCRDRGWLDVFAQPEIDPVRWLGVIEEYVGEAAQDTLYYTWFRQFVSIYICARWLSDYVEAFCSINAWTAPSSLDQITRPRTNPAFQRGGPDAPPIDRAVGMGACFVVRMLVRRGVIQNQLAYRHCYVPSGRLREMLWNRFDRDVSGGYQGAEQIYAFLAQHLPADRATLEMAFDVPFLAILDDPQLERRFFGGTWGGGGGNDMEGAAR